MNVQEFHDAVVNLQPVDLLSYKEIMPEFQLMYDCSQSAPHHEEGSVLIHSQMAGAIVLQLMETEEIEQSDKICLYIATLLHDIGKPATYAISPKHGRITAYGHQQEGVWIAKEFLFKYFPEFDYSMRYRILALIRWHMDPRQMMKEGTTITKMRMLSLAVNTKLLYLLSQADTLGRTAKDMKSGMFLLELFKQNCLDLALWERSYRVPLATSLNKAAYSLARWNILIEGATEDDYTYDAATASMIVPPKPNFQLMMLIGAPGSGKTYIREKLIAQYPDLKIISMDDKRRELTGNINDQSKNNEVFGWQSKELNKAMEARQNTLIDATNPSFKVRKILWKMAREHGALCSAIYFDLPLKTLLERNAQREKRVPDDVVKKFYKSLEYLHPIEADQVTIIQ